MVKHTQTICRKLPTNCLSLFDHFKGLTGVGNYADDTTFHACDSDVEDLLRRLEHDSVLAMEWFESSYMKSNEDKCHFLLSGHKLEVCKNRTKFAKIWENFTEKLLGITI